MMLIIVYLMCIIRNILEDKLIEENKIEKQILWEYIGMISISLSIIVSNICLNMGNLGKNAVFIKLIVYTTLILIAGIYMFFSYKNYVQLTHRYLKQCKVQQVSDYMYYEQMEDLSRKNQEFVHNATHYLKVIGMFAKRNECDEILRIIGLLSTELEEGETVIYSSNHILNTILSEESGEAQKLGVSFDAYVEPGVNLEKVLDIDLIAMLGNLLDNALRATKEIEGWIRVRIFMQDVSGFCIVKITNNFSNEIVLDEEENLVSTKKEKGIHGIGMKSVEKIAQKYGGYLTYNIKGESFETILLLSVV